MDTGENNRSKNYTSALNFVLLYLLSAFHVEQLHLCQYNDEDGNRKEA